MATIDHNASQLYRITYEAYSTFANNISECSSLPEIGKVALKHLKYILNFHQLRIHVESGSKYMEYTLTAKKIITKVKAKKELRDFEKKLIENKIPFKTSNLPRGFYANEESNNLQNPNLWAWFFSKNNEHLIVSLIADDHKNFTPGNIDILKLAVNCLYAKYRELKLNRELARKNRNLENAYKLISNKNEEIIQINNNQKNIIKNRTREIVTKNEKLLQISILNAHSVKEPLSRIQGLIYLFDVIDEDMWQTEILPKLKSSLDEMNEIISQVIDMASKELVESKTS